MELTEAQKVRVVNVWKDIKNGVAKNHKAKAEMVMLYNEIYKGGYKTTSNCTSCLNTCWSGIKVLAEKLG